MKNYKFKIQKETIISRIPSLFPYIEFNEYNICELHSAFDSLNGTYGKIVPNLTVPNSNKHIPYFQMMQKYYNNELSDEEKKFVEKAIGKVKVDKTKFSDKDNDLVPDYIYLATVKGLYFEYSKMSRQCALYDRLPDKDKSKQMCCFCEKYNRMGGDTMLDILSKNLSVAETIANEYLKYANVGNENELTTNINIPLMNCIDDLGVIECNVEEWVAGREYRKNDRVYYDNEVYRCNVEKTHGYYNEETEEIEFDYKNWAKSYIDNNKKTYVLEGKSDSKLTSLRRYTEYLDENDESILPETGEDWLFFYRKGYVANYRTINDIYGNIKHVGDNYENGDDLYAYGDVLTDITVDKEERKIEFTYCLDAHLKATTAGTKTDDDGNIKYYFKDFVMDNTNMETDNHHGVIYTDTYYYDEDSDLDKLVNSAFTKDKKSLFEIYTEDKLNTTESIEAYNKLGFSIFTKFEFNTTSSSTIYTKDIGTEQAVISTVMSDFVTYPNYEDVSDSLQDALLMRRDYFNGISYKPTKDIDVHINRGSTAAFESNLKLGEIHTMEDLENYSNGGYFQLREVSDES